MKSDFLKRICCPPEYMTMPSAGIEIGNKFVRYLEFKSVKGKISLSNFGEIGLPLEVVKDGQIINKESLIKILSSLKDKIKSDFVKVSIPEEKSYIFNVEIPQLKPEEIRQALEFKLEENVPLKLDEIAFNYEIVRAPKDEKENLLLSVSVVPKKLIDDYLEVFNSSGLKVMSFEIESRMLAKSLIHSDDCGTVMILNIKEDSTVMSIVSSKVNLLSSGISIGNSSILKNLSQVFGKTAESNGKISENILTDNDRSEYNISDSLMNIFSVIKDDIEKFNEYWGNHINKFNFRKSIKLDKIIVCGRAAALPGLVNHLGQNIEVETLIGDVWSNVFDADNYLPEIKFFDSLDYAVLVGLALPIKK